MDRETFWRLIEDPALTRLNAGGYTEELTRRLEQLEPAEIVSFENHVNQLMQQINTWELYDILSIVEDYYASDDGFWEFMQGLVAQGRECFEAVRDCPELVGEFDEPRWGAIDRAPLVATRTAFENRTGTLPYQGYEIEETAGHNRQGEPVEEEELRRRYPDLWHRFWFDRDVLGIDPSWLAWNGGAVRKLAEALDRSHHFEDLPVLADALEEAGCEDAAILEHCRAGVVHRGRCWVINALLGKKEPNTMPDG